MFRCAVFETGTGGETVSLPVACILAVMATALGAGVDPDGISRWNHLTAGGIDVAVRTLLALRTAFSRLVDGVDTWRRGAICNQTAGDAITVAGTLLTL